MQPDMRADMETHKHRDIHTYMHAWVHSSRHIPSTVHDLPLVCSAVPMEDAQSHVPWERSAKWVAKFIQGNFEVKMRMIWK